MAYKLAAAFANIRTLYQNPETYSGRPLIQKIPKIKNAESLEEIGGNSKEMAFEAQYKKLKLFDKSITQPMNL